MARALRAWAINRGGKNSVRNLRYGPRTRLVRGICYLFSREVNYAKLEPAYFAGRNFAICQKKNLREQELNFANNCQTTCLNQQTGNCR